MNLLVSIEVRSGGRNEDRAACFGSGDSWILVLADGAGGVGSGAESAEIVIGTAQALAVGRLSTPSAALTFADQEIAKGSGLSTGIIVLISNGEVSGASCGDSEAWLLADGKTLELTSNQSRKPLLGDGARVVPFGPEPFNGRLLMASDGLTKYARWSDVVRCVQNQSPRQAASMVADLARIANGGYQDDISVIVANWD